MPMSDITKPVLGHSDMRCVMKVGCVSVLLSLSALRSLQQGLHPFTGCQLRESMLNWSNLASLLCWLLIYKCLANDRRTTLC